ncbi:MAG: AMP-binding protein [Anaerovoracaceae bacterium]|jgi:long-chain acyl-CoA synthetase|nr:AMP-binding protein [Anaerovoracaceae bacterium]
MNNNMVKAPWLNSYGTIPKSLDYPTGTMVDFLEDQALSFMDGPAYNFLGVKATYREFLDRIHTCAKALVAMGIKKGDKVTICLPNMPQAIIMFYGLNLMGGIPNMVHPLSAQGEIAFYLNLSESVAAITLDAFYSKFESIRKETPKLENIIVTSIGEVLKPLMALGFWLSKGRKIAPVPVGPGTVFYKEFMEVGKKYKGEYKYQGKAQDPAVILYSGGTTGTTKGIVLSNLNFNALAMQTAALGDCLVTGHRMLAIMPVFHGFGLGVGIHTGLCYGCEEILVPQFNVDTYGALLKKYQPNYIAGVPTLFEALLRNKEMEQVDLSCLEGVFSGGDSLSTELKKKVDVFLKDRGAQVQIREGYGTTECVTASCLTPKDFYKEGSIGIPFPDTYYKICKVETIEELPYGEDGEICISGPSVMLGYLKDPGETNNVLKTHSDGRTWLHTGDMGLMDSDGFIYFKQRIKRMIISSGYSIYPSQIENVLDAHPAVLMSTVIGVPDAYKMEKVKAFLVLKPGIEETDEVKDSIYEHCIKNIARYAMPYEFEYRESLPRTLVGKVAYTVLEQEELTKLGDAEALGSLA